MNQRVFAVSARRGLSIAASGAVARIALAISDLAALAIALSIAVGIRVSILPRLSAAFQQPTYPPAHYFELWWLPLVYLPLSRTPVCTHGATRTGKKCVGVCRARRWRRS